MPSQKFTIYIKPNPEGGYVAQCIELPLNYRGETKAVALKKLKEAIESLGWKLIQNY